MSNTTKPFRFFHDIEAGPVRKLREESVSFAYHYSEPPPGLSSARFCELLRIGSRRVSRARRDALSAFSEAGIRRNAVLLIERHNAPDRVFVVHRVDPEVCRVRGQLQDPNRLGMVWLDEILEDTAVVSAIRGPLEPEAAQRVRDIVVGRWHAMQVLRQFSMLGPVSKVFR